MNLNKTINKTISKGDIIRFKNHHGRFEYGIIVQQLKRIDHLSGADTIAYKALWLDDGEVSTFRTDICQDWCLDFGKAIEVII